MEKLKNNKKLIIITAAAVLAAVIILVMLFSDNNEKNFIGTWGADHGTAQTYLYRIKETNKGYLLQTFYVNKLEREKIGTYDSSKKTMSFNMDDLIYEFKYDPENTDLLLRCKFNENDNTATVERLHKVPSNEWD